MANAYSSVSTYMNKIASATNRTLTTKVNVTKTVSTVNAVSSSIPVVANLQNFSAIANRSLAATNALATASVSTVSARSTFGGYSNNGNLYSNKVSPEPIYLDISLELDSKIIAKKTAKYVDGELSVIDKRDSRKRGAK
jgi:hypothetical protein